MNRHDGARTVFGSRARAGGRPAARVASARGDSTLGAASVLLVAVVAVAGLLSVAVAAAAQAVIERHRLSAAADSAALAAADAASGRAAGVPCAEARRLAEASGGRLDACLVDGLVVTVRVASGAGPPGLAAAATAGPPQVGAPDPAAPPPTPGAVAPEK